MDFTQSKVFKRLQTLTATTRYELIAVIVLLAGLIFGALVQRGSFFCFSSAGSPQSLAAAQPSDDELYHLFDSLANAERSTFTGTTPDATPVPELAAAESVANSMAQGAAQQGFSASKGTKKEKITSGTININTASTQDLMRLPGVGEATAEKIVAFRQTQKFRRPEDIMRIKGIGKKKFEAMQKFLSVD
jgi:competence ComEA-like helix-hairpin-helix protein